MSRATNYWKLGLFVVLGVSIGIGVIAWIGVQRLTRASIEAFAFFDESVSGLEVGSPVKFRGVTIGRVADINAAPDRRHVEVRAEIHTDALERLGLRDPKVPQAFGEGEFVPSDLRVQLVSSALTGLSFVQCDFFDPRENPVPAYPFDVPWNTIHSVRSTFKSVEKGVMATLERLPALAERATSLMGRLERGVDQLRPDEISTRARDALRAIEDQVRAIERGRLVERGAALLDGAEQTIAEARAVLRDWQREDGPVRRLVATYDRLGQRLERAVADAEVDVSAGSVRRASDALRRASTEAEQLLRDARDDMRQWNAAAGAIRRLAELLERDPGALLRGRGGAGESTPGRRKR